MSLLRRRRLSSDEVLYRRIKRQMVDWETRDSDDNPRIRSWSFQDYSESKAKELGYPGRCMSVGVGSILAANGGAPHALLEGWGPDCGIAVLSVSDVRSDGEQGIEKRPTEDEPWHAVVFAKNRPKRTGKMESDLARLAKWVIVPDPPPDVP